MDGREGGNGGRLPEVDRGDGPWMDQHGHIVAAEIAAINTRRGGDREINLSVPDARQVLDVVGLALSGGGIRSSAMCLGVLQAFNHHDLIKRIDYLSSVGGGGYIGTSFAATATVSGRFVFGSTQEQVGASKGNAISDTREVGHIRRYANYLLPSGPRDAFTGAAIILRGLIANLTLVLPAVLILAAITIWSTPLRSCLTFGNLFGVGLNDARTCELHDFSLIDRFGFTAVGAVLAVLLALGGVIFRMSRDEHGEGPAVAMAYLAGIVLLLGLTADLARSMQVRFFPLTTAMTALVTSFFFLWSLLRSFTNPTNRQEFRGHLPTIGATLLVLLAATAFWELQPFLIANMFEDDLDDSGHVSLTHEVYMIAIKAISSLSTITAAVAAIVAIFRRQFSRAAKEDNESSILASRLIATAAIWLAGAAFPLVMWSSFLYLSYWGIANDLFERCPPSPTQRECVIETLQLDSKSPAQIKSRAIEWTTPTSHSPAWLQVAGQHVAHAFQRHFPSMFQGAGEELAYAFSLPVIILYSCAGFFLFALSWFSGPNANSLHRLYRDRLSKAFLFDPRYSSGPIGRGETSLDQGRDLRPLDRMKLSNLFGPNVEPWAVEPGEEQRVELKAPYLLINAALNVQGSDFAKRRGRNADFFVLSPLFIGSEATGYAKTNELEDIERDLDLATAMAISGAAASANLEQNVTRPLRLTLTMLNLRFGYWLSNPRYSDISRKSKRRSTPLYRCLWSEISGRLYENSHSVYLTDGGQIENLAIYELLRRRCRVIIVVDAEADAPMNFSSLTKLQRYARIDLGARIDLPWAPIRDGTLEMMARNAGKSEQSASSSAAAASKDRPHVAIGTIEYGGGDLGYLVYIKSSLSGDENDYVRDYARRNDRFPHETTSDQFFSAEQFEVYRALGFHMTHGFLTGDHPVAVGPGVDPRMVRFTEGRELAVDAVRSALGLPIAEGQPRSS